jgi:hypothetical protein
METNRTRTKRPRPLRSLSPRDLAWAIGSSESSLKRWVDDGQIIATRTDGGHRRIVLPEAVRFVRESKQPLMHPEALGLASLSGGMLADIRKGRGEAMLLEALEASDRDRIIGITQGMYMCALGVASICDGPISHAVNRHVESRRLVGEGVDTVRSRGAALCIDAVESLRGLLQTVPDDAPIAAVARGASAWTQMRSTMASVVLTDIGYRVTEGSTVSSNGVHISGNHGSARLVWAAGDSNMGSPASGRDTSSGPEQMIRTMHAAVMTMGARLVLCSRTLPLAPLPPIEHVHVIESMAELAALARSLASTPQVKAPVQAKRPLPASAAASAPTQANSAMSWRGR